MNGLFITINEKKFRDQNGMVYTAVKEIDFASAFSLHKFVARMVNLGVLVIVPQQPVVFTQDELEYIAGSVREDLKCEGLDNKLAQSIQKKTFQELGWK